MVAVNPELMRRAHEAAQALQEEGVLRATYLFGSHVEGRAHEWSDIDIAAFIEGAETWGVWRRAEAAARVQRQVGYDIEPHFFSAEVLENPPQGSFEEHVIKHGIPVP